MTPAQQPASEQRWCLILSAPNEGFSATFYHYPSEAAARADIARLRERPDFARCTHEVVLLEALVKPLSERGESV